MSYCRGWRHPHRRLGVEVSSCFSIFYSAAAYQATYASALLYSYRRHVRSFVRLSVRLSRAGIVSKRSNLGSWNFLMDRSRTLVLANRVHLEIRKCSPRARALNQSRVGKSGDFRPLSRRISQTVQVRTNVAANH